MEVEKGRKVKERDSNIELFRIVTMLLIVAHHYVVNSGLLLPIIENYPSTKSIFLLLFGWGGKTGINCFVLITGYFMCTSAITLRKALKLFLEVEFYNVIFYFIFVATGYIEISLKSLIVGLVPISSIKYDFVSCYLVFFCFIPFLNILINGMNQKQHLILVGLCLLIYTIFPLMLIPIFFSYLSWFMVIYLIAAYLRLYPPLWSLDKKIVGWGMLFCLVLSMTSVIIGGWLSIIYNKRLFYFFVSDSNKPFAVVTAVFAFLFFKNLNIRYSKIINMIAASTFGVLLIHANCEAMRQWLWRETFDNVGHYSGNIYLHAILSVIVVYVVCTIIDYCRIKVLENYIFRLIDNKIENNGK